MKSARLLSIAYNSYTKPKSHRNLALQSLAFNFPALLIYRSPNRALDGPPVAQA